MKLNDESFFKRALTCADNKNYIEARSLLHKLSPKYANNSEYNFYLGLTELNLNQYEDAILHLNQSIQLNPNDCLAFQALGTSLSLIGKSEEAIIAFDQAIDLDGSYSDLYNDKGVILLRLRRYEESLSCFFKAINLDPFYAEAYSNYGFALFSLRKFKESVVAYDQAIKLDRNLYSPNFFRAEALRELGYFKQALIGYDLAISFGEGDHFVELCSIFVKMHLCEWDNFDELRANIVKKTELNAVQSPLPFVVAALLDNLSLQKKSAELHSKLNFPIVSSVLKSYKSNPKIRLGYFSSDFYQHPVSYLTAELFELHDRENFEVIAFSISPANDDPLRQRLRNGFDRFLCVENKSDEEIVEIARDLDIDIAIDMGGFTKNCRPGIFALRAAPVQVNYLGYPGTMGSKFMDYIIADQVIIPKSKMKYYTEKVAYLPHSYMPNDSKTRPSSKKISKQDVGLPEDKFIFCCFNAPYKISPDMFSIWARILTAVDNSVLWLGSMNETAMTNIKNTAEKLGVNRERIIFAKREDLVEDHLCRLTLADLFLDTFPYNAHTTANDALKVGLPVLTIAGKSFASRVAASLLNTLDLNELVVTKAKDYELLAISLASDSSKLKKVKEMLLENIKTSPLFNTKLFTNNLELIYKEMYKKYQSGSAVDDIYIS